MTLEELSSRVNDLHKKLGIAQRTGNAHLCNQVRMALETFNAAYQARLRESYKNGPDAPNFDNIINIE